MLLLHLQPHGLLWLLGMEKVSCCSGGLKVFPCVILYLVRLSEAVLWALQLALSEQFLYVIIEGDSQICMDSLNGNSSYGSWSISSICNDILALCKSFSGCNFCQVKREANNVAHSLAKFASTSPFPLNCNISPILPSGLGGLE